MTPGEKSSINTIWKWYKIGCQLLLITNRKSHMGFQLIPTLNDLERCNSPYFVFLKLNSIALQTDCFTVVEDRPIMFIKYCLPLPVFCFWPKLTHPAAQSFCDSWASSYFCHLLSVQGCLVISGVCLSVCPFVCLLATLHRNYRPDL